jgi:circadian clock protein KaiB
MSQLDHEAGRPVAEVILFVTGDSPRSGRARSNLDTALQRLGVAGTSVHCIDLLTEPERINEYGIFATPALIRPRTDGDPSILYGDLSNEGELQRFLADLGGPVTA